MGVCYVYSHFGIRGFFYLHVYCLRQNSLKGNSVVAMASPRCPNDALINDFEKDGLYTRKMMTLYFSRIRGGKYGSVRFLLASWPKN